MAAKRDSETRRTSAFETAMTVSLWAWISLNAVLAMWLNTRLEPVIVFAAPPVALGLLCAWIHYGRAILLDIQPWFGVKEKFAHFLLSCVFFIAPNFIDFRFDPVLSLVALNFPLGMVACQPRHFQRIYCLNLAILFLIVRGAPEFPGVLLLAEAFLICLCFAFDYVAFRARERPDAQAVEPGLLARAMLPYLTAAAGALVACWAMAPDLRPQWFRVEGLLARAVNSTTLQRRRPMPFDQEDLKSLAIDAAILIVVSIITILTVRWMIGRLAKKKKSGPLLVEDEKFMLRKAPRLAAGRSQAFDPSTPRGRIVQAYNRFLETLEQKGLGKPNSATPSEYAAELEKSSTLSRKNLGEITAVFERAHYGESEFSDQEAQAYCERAERMAGGAARLSGEDVR